MIELHVAGSDRPALVDDAYAHLAAYKWKLRQGYAVRSSGGRKIALHHVVLPGDGRRGLVRDHINRDRLDNRTANLRWVTAAENVQNRSPARRNATGCRGVRFEPSKGQYLARIQHHGKAVFRGWFDTIEEADAHLTSIRQQYLPASIEVAGGR